MYYHADAKLVYLAHPRTASHSVSDALLEIGFKRRYPGDHHTKLFEVPGIVTPETRKDWYVFTFVRNHFDAVVSWMLKSPLGKLARSQLWSVEQIEERLDPSKKWFQENSLWQIHAADADEILRYERLEPDLNRVLASKKLPEVILSPKNVSDYRDGRAYWQFYTRETRGYIQERFGAELDELGYHF